MKFGILMELQTPRPWTPESELNSWQNGLEQLEVADRIGIDYLWQVEHHFLEEYSHSSAVRELPGRGQPAHQADASGVGRHPAAAADQPSGARGGAGRRAGPAEPGPRGIRHR